MRQAKTTIVAIVLQKGFTMNANTEMTKTREMLDTMHAELSKTRKMSMIKESLNFKIMDLRKKMRKEDRTIIQAMNRRKPLSVWISNKTQRVVVVDNRGEEDNIMFGKVVDVQSAHEGFGVECETISTRVYMAILGKEEKIREESEKLEDMEHSLRLVQKQIEEVKADIKEMEETYGKAIPQDEERLAHLEKWEENLEGWIKSKRAYVKSLDEDITQMETRRPKDADYSEKEEKYNYTHWVGVHNYGERLVLKIRRNLNRYNNKQLVLMIKRANQLRYGDSGEFKGTPRMAGRQLSFKHWVQLYWILNLELYKRTNNRWYAAKVDKAKAFWHDNDLGSIKESEVKADPEASFFGSMSLDEDEILQVIDATTISNKEARHSLHLVRRRIALEE